MSEVTTRALDLAARTIDLTLALASTSTSEVAVRLAWQVGQWLGREGVNQYELQDCMEKAKGLFHPNQDNNAFFWDIVESSKQAPIGPMFLRKSGSLGRLMARDPALRWLISSTACLFQFNRDTEFISAVLIALTLEGRADGNASESDSLFYRPAQVQIKAVVEKIVLSIWHNVVNAGRTTIPLPPQLYSAGHHGHDLDPSDFAKVAYTLTSRCRSSAILKTEHLLRNITLWLLLHYDGTVVVNIGGSIAYRKQLDDSARELEINVKQQCQGDDTCSGSMVEKYSILQSIAGEFEFLLSGHSMNSFEVPPSPGIRQPLYESPVTYPRDSIMWNRGVQSKIRATAQALTRLLLQTRLVPQTDFSELGFSVLLVADKPAWQTIALHEILKQSPGILNMNWGLAHGTALATVDYTYPNRLEQNRTVISDLTQRNIRDLIGYFPNLDDLTKGIVPDCGCFGCHERRRLSPALQERKSADHVLWMQSGSFPPGCLARMALDETMILVAHGIADGFGVDDVSGKPDQQSLVEGMYVLLLDLARDNAVKWDVWFSIAASVYLGCPFMNSPGPDHPAYGGTAIAAIQFGDLVAQAPWLDLHSRLTAYGSFSLIAARGRLGVVEAARDGSEDHFRGIEANFAIIETENTEDTTSYCSRVQKNPESSANCKNVDLDTTLVSSDVILVSVHDFYYRILMRVKTARHWRIIDPSDAMSAAIRALHAAPCTHDASVGSVVTTRPLKMYTFEEVLGRWPDTVQPQRLQRRQNDDPNEDRTTSGTLHVSRILGSHFVANVASALSVCCTSIVAISANTCVQCQFEQAIATEREPLRTGEGGDPSHRYIISLSNEIAHRPIGLIEP